VLPASIQALLITDDCVFMVSHNSILIPMHTNAFTTAFAMAKIFQNVVLSFLTMRTNYTCRVCNLNSSI
jgi:hypothetical protein